MISNDINHQFLSQDRMIEPNEHQHILDEESSLIINFNDE